jgi:hypothetical protein
MTNHEMSRSRGEEEPFAGLLCKPQKNHLQSALFYSEMEIYVRLVRGNKAASKVMPQLTRERGGKTSVSHQTTNSLWQYMLLKLIAVSSACLAFRWLTHRCRRLLDRCRSYIHIRSQGRERFPAQFPSPLYSAPSSK